MRAWTLAGAAAATGGLSIMLSAGIATAVPEPVQPATHRLASTLSWTKVVPEPTRLRAGVTGRLRGTARVQTPSGVQGAFLLTFSRLTAPPTSIALRFGRAGETGHVWNVVCNRWRPPCPKGTRGSVRGSFHAYRDPWLFEKYAFYVDIRTATNPLGELRGQIEVTRAR